MYIYKHVTVTLCPQVQSRVRECDTAEALLALTVVWHHHSKGTEESLQVVRELSAAGVPGVHGDKDGTCPNELDLSTFKHESLHLMGWAGSEGRGRRAP